MRIFLFLALSCGLSADVFTTFPSAWQNCGLSVPCVPNVLYIDARGDATFVTGTTIRMTFFDDGVELAHIDAAMQPNDPQPGSYTGLVFYSPSAPSDWTTFPSAIMSFDAILSGCLKCTAVFERTNGHVGPFGASWSLGIDRGDGTYATQLSWSSRIEGNPLIVLPEPSTYAMLGLGAAALIGRRFRK